MGEGFELAGRHVPAWLNAPSHWPYGVCVPTAMVLVKHLSTGLKALSEKPLELSTLNLCR
jgi:hypothetical protein